MPQQLLSLLLLLVSHLLLTCSDCICLPQGIDRAPTHDLSGEELHAIENRNSFSESTCIRVEALMLYTLQFLLCLEASVVLVVSSGLIHCDMIWLLLFYIFKITIYNQ